MPGIKEFRSRTYNGLRLRGEKDPDVIAGPAGGIDLRRIRYIRKVKTGFDSDADGMMLLLMTT